MLIALWIINIILALLMLGAGFAKATSPKAKLAGKTAEDVIREVLASVRMPLAGARG